MLQYYPDEGLPNWLNRLLLADLRFHLGTNNLTPDRDTVLADLTEAAFAGYASIIVPFADWTLMAVAGHVQRATADPITFSNTSGGAVNVYTYYVTDSGSTVLLAVARLDGAPVSIPATTGTLVVVPYMGDFSGPV